MSTDTIEVREKHRFDTGALHTWMKGNVDGFSGELSVQEFAGGQSNPTYKLEAGGRRYVLRRKPAGKLLKSAHAVDREFRVLHALQGTGVPVPKVYSLCTDNEVIGSWFYVMDYLDGRVIWDSTAKGKHSRQDRHDMWHAAVQAIASLHKVDFQKVGLDDYGKHSDYIARQIKRWAGQYEYTKTTDNPWMDKLIDYLPAHIPGDETCTIVHGDCHLANMMMHRDRFEVIGLLDWELSTLGNPLSDLAYLIRPYRDPELIPHLDTLGFPPEEELVQAYCQETGRNSIKDWDYYLAFNFFRLSGIFQGIARRGLDGTAAGNATGLAEAQAIKMARVGWEQIDKT